MKVLSELSPLANPGPYHIISYGTLLGTSVFQTFIGGIVAYQRLPRPQFSHLQTGIFPLYFSLQTAVPVVLALTYPGTASPLPYTRTAIPSSIRGILVPQNRFSVLLPLATMFVAGLANLVIVGPMTQRIIKDRKRQETRDGKRSFEKGPHTKKMEKLNKDFSHIHAVSSVINLVAVAASVWYGWSLGDRLR